MADVRTRRDIWSLESEKVWHPITRAYALAVEELQERSRRDPSSPTGWDYQATVHAMPDLSQPDEFRGQCQHFSWYFLPWHRLYLYWFEQLVLSVVQAHDDIDEETKRTWALPYWNYTPGGARASLPEAFRRDDRPDAPGARNALFDGSRNQWINDGESIAWQETTPEDVWIEEDFSLRRPAGGFGGAATGFNNTRQDPNAWSGALEDVPHGTVHGAVGGNMGDFPTAGLDPVFWMHHANIDRMWVVWLALGGRRANPPAGRWTTMSFKFHDPKGDEVTGSVAGTLDTVADMSYEYEDVAVPRLRRRARPVVPSEPPPDHPPELVGATDDSLDLTGRTERVPITVGEPTGPARRRGRGDPARVYLTVEGIEGERSPDINYAVYVNLPENVDADPDNDELTTYYAGALSFFGIERSRQVETDPGGHALARSFDITQLVTEQQDAGVWDPDEWTVTFVPLHPRSRRRRRGGAAEQESGPPVKVGRVGVYYQ